MWNKKIRIRGNRASSRPKEKWMEVIGGNMRAWGVDEGTWRRKIRVVDSTCVR